MRYYHESSKKCRRFIFGLVCVLIGWQLFTSSSRLFDTLDLVYKLQIQDAATNGEDGKSINDGRIEEGSKNENYPFDTLVNIEDIALENEFSMLHGNLSWIAGSIGQNRSLLVISVTQNGMETSLDKAALSTWLALERLFADGVHVAIFAEKQNAPQMPNVHFRKTPKGYGKWNSLSDRASVLGNVADLLATTRPSYVLFVEKGLFLSRLGNIPQTFLSLDWNVATGMTLSCAVSDPSLTSPTNTASDVSDIETRATSCQFRSAVKPQYMLVRLPPQTGSFNATMTQAWIEWTIKNGSIADLSPIWLPIKVRGSPPKTESYLMEAFVRTSMNVVPVLGLSTKVCPANETSPDEVELKYLKAKSFGRWRDLNYIWTAASPLWISPFKIGHVSHAKRLGCSGYDAAIADFRETAQLHLTDAEIQWIGKMKLEVAAAFNESAVDHRQIGNEIFPFNNISVDCKRLFGRCFLHLNGTLMEYTAAYQKKYRPLITTYLRASESASKSKFAICFSPVDKMGVWLGSLLNAKKPETYPAVTMPRFENSACSREWLLPKKSFEEFKHIRNFNGVSNFLDFDHVYIALGDSKASRKRYRNSVCGMPFEKREKIVVFRGAPSGTFLHPFCRPSRGCDPYAELELSTNRADIQDRIGMVMWSKRFPDLFDFKFSSLGRQASWDMFKRMDVATMFEYQAISPDDYFCKYHQVVVINGIGSAFRLPQHFKSEQCVYLQHGNCFQWYYPYLKPWVHYVPFEADLSDLVTNARIVRNTPGLAEKIARNGKIFYDRYLSWDSIRAITGAIMDRIINTTKFSVDENTCLKSMNIDSAYVAPYYNKTYTCRQLSEIRNITCRNAGRRRFRV